MKRPELLIVDGALAGKRFQVKSGGLRLGRSSSNDIHIPDEQLSRNHCLFEPVGDGGIRLTDLASANGTYLNGKPLGSDPADLASGDVIEVGVTHVRVIGEGKPSFGPRSAASKVDLGFGPDAPAPEPEKRRRSAVANALWAAVVVLVGVAVYLVLTTDRSAAPVPKPVQAEDENPPVCELRFEKVEANAEGIFRYELTLTPDGVLKGTLDDVPKEDRHLSKSVQLGEAARRTLNEILSFKTVKALEREYAGPEPDPPALFSQTLKVVYTDRSRTVRVVNTQEPAAFRDVRARLEAFSKNELGVWAIQYSRDKLVRLAEESLTLGRTKFEDRDVNFGNLASAVAAFREVLFYLETVNPKPPCHAEASAALEKAVGELDRRYADQRFLADRACNLGQWDVARRELGVLLEMVPDRNDDRHREATAKLLDVEKRMQKGAR